MNEEFYKIVEQMPDLLNQLSKLPLRPWGNLGELPTKGIYVFYEDGRPVYVGRSRNLERRLKEHGNQSSTHYSSSFAFNMAKNDAVKKGVDINRTRKQLDEDPAFNKLFSEAKTRVSNMGVRVIAIDDAIVQTLFEVYASVALDTREYNYFDTH